MAWKMGKEEGRKLDLLPPLAPSFALHLLGWGTVSFSAAVDPQSKRQKRKKNLCAQREGRSRQSGGGGNRTDSHPLQGLG